MAKIRILPEEVVNKIAAGEVIERPASVVKELVENSIDADAKHINITFEQAGKKYICVSDDGIGMSPEDATMALQRFATSKITQFEDLFKLTTLGFRGEALPSIAAVSRLKLVTCARGTSSGYMVICEGGKILQATKVGTPEGTIVEVSDLLFNTPARKKFLKNDTIEQGHIIRTVEELSLAHFMIGFTLLTNNKEILSSPPVQNLSERIVDIMGRDILENLISIDYHQQHLHIYGFVSRVDFSQPNKSIQYFFIHRRPVTNRVLSQALYDAYRDSLPSGRHPVGIIFFDIDPKYIDVNVHPTKRLVKLSDEKKIYNTLLDAIKKQLVKKVAIFQPQTKVTIKTTPKVSDETLSAEIFTQPQFTFGNEGTTDEKSHILEDARLIGQIFDLYWILQAKDNLLIIDQHAAYERVLYEKFKSTTLEKEHSQQLLIPVIINTSISQTILLKQYLHILSELGFEIEEFGKNTFIFKAYPAKLCEIANVERFLDDFLNLLQQDLTNSQFKSLEPKEKVIRAACAAAVKSHQYLDKAEIEQLIKDLGNCSQPLTCPHGRPTILTLHLNSISRHFRRK